MSIRFLRSSLCAAPLVGATLAVSLLSVAGLAACTGGGEAAGQPDPSPIVYEDDGSVSIAASFTDVDSQLNGSVDTVAYQQAYRGVTYDKEAYVYVPPTYSPDTPANIVYLTHGWQGSAAGLAEGVVPVVDELTASGQLSPTLVVFATYYPDRSFAGDDYEDDYELNRFFATTEIDTIIDAVESRYATYAGGDTSDQSLQDSRTHRAFGGFSMGATTTWDVFSMRPQYFYGYMPMAGESWIGRETDADIDQIAHLIAAGAERADYGAQDFRILASVGSDDPALWDMSPQLEQLQFDYPDLMTPGSLQLWIDEGEDHSMASIQNQVAHNLPRLLPQA
ncbi:alpha/beta hydrolase [Kytococcus sedentarius]|uniref:alpha/beta hydrolase n=1 Tax=Kytococcus sedentarius TaxID=1276 RepID=UPI000660D07F|nr:hypothetical protein [Kytococcus sedentarius]